MKTALIVFNFFIANYIIAQTTDYIFITTLELDYIKTSYNNSIKNVPYEEFINEYKLELFIRDEYGNVTDKTIQFILTKNTIYNNDPFNYSSILLIIIIPKNLYIGPLNINATVYEKLTLKKIAAKDILLTIPNINSNLYLYHNMFWVTQPIKIGYPAEVSVNLMIKYINNILDPNHISGYYSIITKIDFLTEFNISEVSNSYPSLRKLTELSLFIEPYIDKSSFLSSEARELNKQINLLKLKYDTVKHSNDTLMIKNLVSDIDRLEGIYIEYFELLSKLERYQIFIDSIYKKYYSALENISNNSKVRDLHKQTIYNFSGGANLSSTFPQVYDVIISEIDTTVQFDAGDSGNLALSAGFVIEPRSGYFGTTGFGVFLLYYITSQSEPMFSSNNLGWALGIGFGIYEVDLFMTIGFRNIRLPRQYFIDQYLGQNRKLPFDQTEIDYNNNSLFFNKNAMNFGVNLSYPIRFR